jgi:hypothetical protein
MTFTASVRTVEDLKEDFASMPAAQGPPRQPATSCANSRIYMSEDYVNFGSSTRAPASQRP